MSTTPGYSAIRGMGNLGTGDMDVVFNPRYPRGSSKYGVVLCHGANSLESFQTDAWPDLTRMVGALCNAGIPAISGWFGSTPTVETWANDTSMSRVTSAISRLSSVTGCSSTKAHLIGVSMGGGVALRYAQLNPTKVASVTGIVPMVNPQRMYVADNPAGMRAGVQTSWSITQRAIASCAVSSGAIGASSSVFTSADVGSYVVAGTAIPASQMSKITSYSSGTLVGFSPSAVSTGTMTVTLIKPMPTTGDVYAASASLATSAIPNRLFYSTVDAYITPYSDVTSFASSSGGTAIAIDSTYGHANGTVASMRTYNGGSEFSELITWLQARGA